MFPRLFNYFDPDLAVDPAAGNTPISIVGEGLVLDESSVAAVCNQPSANRFQLSAVGYQRSACTRPLMGGNCLGAVAVSAEGEIA
jgi:hypothetical protein